MQLNLSRLFPKRLPLQIGLALMSKAAVLASGTPGEEVLVVSMGRDRVGKLLSKLEGIVMEILMRPHSTKLPCRKGG